jgi:hypothetical protein
MTDRSNKKIDAFLLGVPKGASTWIYQCLKERDDVYVPDSDSLRFFDLKYHKGMDWYLDHFKQADQGVVVVDPSPTYLRSQLAAERIAENYPDAKFVVCLRNPVDRAFSQFWHEKKEGNFNFEFEDVLNSFLLNSWYVETGNYATQLENYFKLFDRKQFHIVLFDDLTNNPENFIKSIYDFLGVDPAFTPSVINKKVNEAGVRANTRVRLIKKVKKSKLLMPVKRLLKRGHIGEKIVASASDNKEYQHGISDEMKKELQAVYADQVNRLEVMLDMDLSSWKS